MNADDNHPGDDRSLAGWDRLEVPEHEARRPPPASGDEPVPDREDRSAIPLIAGSWGDLALVLGVAAAALVALKLAGHGAPLAAVGWALGLAVTWWIMTAAILVAVRRATPGMLMAGIRFARTVQPGRVPWVVAVALLLGATLGIPSAIGPRGWALCAAAGSNVIATDELS
jgi:hypothetical protein